MVIYGQSHVYFVELFLFASTLLPAKTRQFSALKPAYMISQPPHHSAHQAGGEEVRANLLRGRSSAKPEAHES